MNQRYRLTVIVSGGKSRTLARKYKDWFVAAEHGEKMVRAKRILGFRVLAVSAQ